MRYCDLKNELTPNDILHRITNMNLRHADSYTYIICGKSGPTGKTWLWKTLKCHGFNAIEISEDIVGLVEYRDDKNYFIVNERDGFIIIILNKLLERGNNT